MRTARIAIASALALAACGGSDPGRAPSPTPGAATERPSSTATLTIEAPANGEVVPPGAVVLVLGLDGAELVEATSTELRPDQGHLHVTLDGELVSMTSGLEQTLPPLTAGTHLVKVEFVANDHAPFEPRVLAATTFEVRAS